jgi:hypothetical protein
MWIKDSAKEIDQGIDNKLVWMNIWLIRDDPGRERFLLRMSNEDSLPGHDRHRKDFVSDERHVL